MRHHIRYGIIALSGVLALLLLLAACGVPSQTQETSAAVASPTPSSSLKSVDWPNFTYFTNCYENTQPFHAQHGQATNNYVHFYVYTPKYGDLTGDGQPEAVVPYQCSAADAMGVHVFVYTGTAAHPRLLGDLPLKDSQNAIANVTTITISNEELHLEGDGYSSSAPHCCPDLYIKTDYKWNGKTFVIIQSHVSPR